MLGKYILSKSIRGTITLSIRYQSPTPRGISVYVVSSVHQVNRLDYFSVLLHESLLSLTASENTQISTPLYTVLFLMQVKRKLALKIFSIALYRIWNLRGKESTRSAIVQVCKGVHDDAGSNEEMS
jgi:hypothetical protein